MKTFLLVLASLVLLAQGEQIWTYSSETVISASPGDVTKIETRVYKDPTAAQDTYILCIATLTSSGTTYLERRKFQVGWTGIEGPEIVSTSQFPTSVVFNDIDIVDSKEACVFVGLAGTDVYEGQSAPYSHFTVPSARTRIEVTTNGASNQYYYMDSSTWYLPPGIYPWNSLPIAYSLDAIYLGSGIHAAVGCSWSGGEYFQNRLITSAGGIDDIFSFGAIDPTALAWSNTSMLACASSTDGWIPCVLYPDHLEVQTLQSSLGRYSAPVLSRLNPAARIGSLAAIFTETSSGAKSLNVLVVNEQGNSLASSGRPDVNRVSQSGIDNYIFVVYNDPNGLQLDVLYYGLEAPAYPPPMAPVTPVAAPVEAPVSAPSDAPSNAPVTSPATTGPVANTPVAVPLVNRPVASPQVNESGLTGGAVGADVLGPAIAIPVAAAAVGVFLLVFLLKKKQTKDKADKKHDSASGESQVTQATQATDRNLNYGSIPAQSNGASNASNNSAVTSGTNATSRSNGEQHYGAIMTGALATDTPKPSAESLAMTAMDIDKRMQIPYKSLVFVKEIGAGSYGKVFLGEWRGADVAIKVNNQITDTEGFLAEAKLTLGIAPHPNLVQTFGVSLDGPNPCIVLEFCGGGSLDKFLATETGNVTNARRKDIALRIAYGLLHLHNNNIVHRDLAARNILLANDGQPKISDFGMSRIVQEEAAKGKTKATVGPLRWMAPESLRDRSYSPKSDVWSYGIMLWEIVTGQEPHENEDQLMVGAKIRDEFFTPPIPEACEPSVRHVMEMCWNPNPSERPSMEEIVEYFRSH